MRMLSQCLLGVALLGSLAACSSARHILQPVVKRNGHAITSENPAVSEDLRACRTEVREAAPVSIQPRWLPPLGATANRVVLGTVDVPHPVWPLSVTPFAAGSRFNRFDEGLLEGERGSSHE